MAGPDCMYDTEHMASKPCRCRRRRRRRRLALPLLAAVALAAAPNVASVAVLLAGSVPQSRSGACAAAGAMAVVGAAAGDAAAGGRGTPGGSRRVLLWSRGGRLL